jgi:aminomethyltransferase
MSEQLRRTPLHAEHLRLGAKMVPFAGWSMPVQYPTGIRAEHRAVREAAGLFDVSHMGEFELSGPEALRLVQRVAVNDASRLEVGQAQYSALCLEDGGVLDDLLIYRTAEEDFLLVVNAANREEDFRWIRRHAEGMDLSLEDRSDDYALLALQGPRAAAILEPLADIVLDDVSYYRFARGRVAGVPTLIARTGYTGEDGFELYLGQEDAVRAWRALLEAGEGQGLLPAGLGARDTLRLEVGYPLHGSDLGPDRTALEAGLGWIVKLEREDFVGQRALARQKEEGVEWRLAGIRLAEKGFPRPGYPVVADGREVGVLTSGTVSPSLGVGIGLAYLPTALAQPGTRVAVRIRDRDVPGAVERPPFYRDGSIRR